MAAVKTAAGEGNYYERFVEASIKQKGFLWDSSLVETNNPGPPLTNAPVSFAQLSEHGELAGVKLGMTMSEVVSAWGKPRRLITHCFIGPRFWYGSGQYGDLSLFFVGDRLVVIVIHGSQAEHLTFDNGLAGRMSSTEYERVLGPPALRDPDARDGLFVGKIAYRTGKLRTDLGFSGTPLQGYPATTERLSSIAVCLEREAASRTTVGPDPASNAAPPQR